MPQIDVSDDVFAAIQSRAEPLIDTADSVLRRLLLPSNPPTKSGRLLPLLNAGVLSANDELVWHREHLGETHHAKVLEAGSLQLEDGKIVTSLSGACKILSDGLSVDGWYEWRRASDNARLSDLRERAGVTVHRRRSGKRTP